MADGEQIDGRTSVTGGRWPVEVFEILSSGRVNRRGELDGDARWNGGEKVGSIERLEEFHERARGVGRSLDDNVDLGFVPC